MCLYTKDGYSNGRYFDRFHMQRYVISQPCGQCAECRQQKRTEWYIRNYFQIRECKDNGGFGLFESLTYADEWLPKASRLFSDVAEEEDFSCVSKDDVQDFLDRLHTNLDYRYFGANFGFKHFIVAEYGHDETYEDDYGRMRKGTERPHYHMFGSVKYSKRKVVRTINKYTKHSLDFLRLIKPFPKDFDKMSKYRRKKWLLENFPYGEYEAVMEITPYDLAYEIGKAWQKGNTDNFKFYRRSGELLEHPHAGRKLSYNTIGIGARSSDTDLRKVTNYISKYVSKDNSSYFPKLDARAVKMARAMVLDKWIPDASPRLRTNLINLCHMYYQARKRSDEAMCCRVREMIDGVMNSEDFATWINRRLAPRDFDVDGFLRAMGVFEDEGRHDELSVAYREVRSRIGLFHLQSDGYGVYALNDGVFGTLEELENEGTIELMDCQNVVVHLPAPKYYIRKHLYGFEKVKDVVRWYVKPGMMDNVERVTRMQVRKFADKCRNTVVNMSQQEQQRVKDILSGRSMEDYAEYFRVYRGRLHHPDFDYKPSIRQVLDYSNSFVPFKKGQWFQYRGKRMDEGMLWTQDFVFADGEVPWYGFDDLTVMLDKARLEPNSDKQEVFDKKECLPDVYKKFFA